MEKRRLFSFSFTGRLGIKRKVITVQHSGLYLDGVPWEYPKTQGGTGDLGAVQRTTSQTSLSGESTSKALEQEEELPRSRHCRTMAHLLAHGSACQVPAAASRLSQRAGTASAAPQERLALQRCATAARKLKGMQHAAEGHPAGPRCSVSVSNDTQTSAPPTEGTLLLPATPFPCTAPLIVETSCLSFLRAPGCQALALALCQQLHTDAVAVSLESTGLLFDA